MAALLLFTVVLLLAGCTSDGQEQVKEQGQENVEQNGQAQVEETTRVVTDQFGEVEVPLQPKRVTALYREDYLVALGVQPIVQYFNPMWGKQDYLQLEVPLFDVTGSVEALLVAGPDLIIAAGEVDEAKYEQYSKVAPTYRLQDEVLADTRQTLAVIADLLGMPEKAEEVLQTYDNRIAEVKAVLGEAIGQEKIVVLRMNVVDKSINIFGINNSFVGQILYKDLGLDAPQYAKDMAEGNIVLSLEAIPELNADHIILIPSNGTWEDEGTAQALEEMLASPLWQTVPAVKQGQVYPAERSFWQSGAITANFRKMDDLMERLAK